MLRFFSSAVLWDDERDQQRLRGAQRETTSQGLEGVSFFTRWDGERGARDQRDDVRAVRDGFLR